MNLMRSGWSGKRPEFLCRYIWRGSFGAAWAPSCRSPPMWARRSSGTPSRPAARTRASPAVEEGELPGLEVKVDVLSPFEAVESPAELDPQRYGVIVEKGSRRGLLLPRLEGVDSVHQQLGHRLPQGRVPVEGKR